MKNLKKNVITLEKIGNLKPQFSTKIKLHKNKKSWFKDDLNI